METAPAAPEAAPKPAEVASASPAAPAQAAETPQAEPQKPERTFTQAELDEIVEKRLAKERRKRDEIRTERDVLRKLALERPAPEKAQEPAQRAQVATEPTRDQFQTYEEFIEARAAYRAEQKVDSKLKEREAADRELAAQTEQQKAREQFQKSMRESAKDIEDFDDVVRGIRASDPVANVAASALEAADAPGKVLYHLATHPDEAERIASLSVGKQARAIVELEAKLAKPPIKPSKAPEPIKPVAGAKAATGDEMPDPAKEPEKWLKWRNAQIAARRAKGVAA